MKFGEMVKDLRIQRKKTLREFCALAGVDPSNWSKIERCISPAPRDQNTLIRLADFFDLIEDQRQTFFDLAALSHNEIPHDMASNEKVLQSLPAFFRAARGHNLTEEKLNDLIEDVRLLHSPDKK
jgi:transcriptional regulator with XRE-family HTH domain